MVFVDSTNKKLEFWTTGSAFIKTYQLVLPPERQTNTWKHWKRLFLLPLPNASSFALHLLQLSKKRHLHRGLIREPCWVQGWFARCSAEMEMVVVHLFGPPKWQIHGKMEWSFLSPKHMGIITSKNEGCQGSPWVWCFTNQALRSFTNPYRLCRCVEGPRQRGGTAWRAGKLQFLVGVLVNDLGGFLWNYCWWFRNPANQLRLVVCHTIYKVFSTILDGCLGFLPSMVF